MVEDIFKNSFSVGYHCDMLKAMAHNIKRSRLESIDEAAYLMSVLLEDRFSTVRYSLVPIPQHTGIAEYTLELCRRIAKRTHAEVLDILRCKPRESFYWAKKEGRDISKEIEFFVSREVPEGTNIILVDNVVATGTTVSAARRALGTDCTLITLTNSKNIDK